ncbi:MAG: nicotinate (nicotinamide) nucleotide adenylyltransferase [Clostridia bacterium]
MKIGVFGGTFNPPHLGHKRLALEFKTLLNLDKILIIPTYAPPHKTAHELVSSEDRLRLCKACFDDDFFTISDIEIQRQGKSYTVQTLKQLHKLYEGEEFYLIIGSDMLLTFHQWFEWKKILELCTICALTRENDISTQQLKQYSKEMLNLDEQKGEIIIMQNPPFECSSTEVRQMIKDNQDLIGVLSEKVIKFIDEKRLWHE